MNDERVIGGSAARSESIRVELTEVGDYPSLRDYFLRLGASVGAEGETIEVQFPPGLLRDDESAETYFQTWASLNGAARLVEADPLDAPPQTADPTSFPSSAGKPPLRLGDLLVSKGLITEDQLSRALIESRQTGEPIGRVLVRNGSVFESELARVLAEQWSIPYVNLAVVGVDRSTLHLLPREIGLHHAAVPVRFVGNELRVAFADPSDAEAVAAVQGHLADPIQPAIAEMSDIDAIWRSVAA